MTESQMTLGKLLASSLCYHFCQRAQGYFPPALWEGILLKKHLAQLLLRHR